MNTMSCFFAVIKRCTWYGASLHPVIKRGGNTIYSKEVTQLVRPGVCSVRHKASCALLSLPRNSVLPTAALVCRRPIFMPTWSPFGWRTLPASLHTSAVRADEERPALSQRQRLKLAVRDYGATVIVFHVTISLASLGIFYLAVKSGLDVVGLLRWLGLGDSVAQSRLVTGGSTFVLAYAVHKVFAPVRIATTLACTPFIVQYLRRRGVLRTPPPKRD